MINQCGVTLVFTAFKEISAYDTPCGFKNLMRTQCSVSSWKPSWLME